MRSGAGTGKPGAGVAAAFKSLVLSAAFKQRNPFSQRIMRSSAEHTYEGSAARGLWAWEGSGSQDG